MGDAEVKDDEPAIRALGSLFKLSEVFIWDDGTTEIWQPSSVSKHIRFKFDDDVDEDDGKNSSNSGQTSPRTTDNNTLSKPEDLDLTEHMSALGLPLAFSSSKERYGTSKGKRKGKRIMNRCCQEKIKDEALGSAEFREEENLPNAKFHVDRNNSVCVSLPCQSDQSCHNVAVDIYESSLSLPEGEIVTNLGAKSSHDENVYDALSSNSCCLPANHESVGSNLVVDISAATTSDLCSGPASSGGCMLDKSIDQVEKGQGSRLMECVNSEDPLSGDVIVSKELGSFVVTEQPHVSVSAEHFSDVVSHEEFESSGCNGSFGDWRVFWDSFYMRNFFYNVKTCESTWDPPPGMENFAFANVSNTSSDSNAEMAEMDVEPIPPSTESVVVNPYYLTNKTGLDEEYCTGDALWVHAQLVNEKVSSDVDIFSYSTCVGNVSKLHEPDESHVDEVSISSSLDILECKLISETDTTQVGSFASLGGHLQMKFANEVDGFDSLVNNGEIACCNDDGGAIAQSPEAGSLLNAGSRAVCSQTFIHHVCSDRMEATVDGFDTENLPSMRKQKKKARKARLRKKSLGDDEQLQFWCTGKKFHVDISKYWCQRYLLFSRFDHGVTMDEEGWFSVTPEPIARHQASRCGGSIIIDGFAGVGGNAIQFAKNSKHVIAIDIDPKKIEYAQHNAGIYGVEDQIDFINGDSLFLAPKLKADTVFLSPPWGGPDYLKVKTYDIMMLKPHSGQFLFDTFRVIASRVVMFLPRNVNLNQLAELSLSADPPWSLEVEKNFLNGKLKAVTAYFSKTIV